jgi:DNA topoisomerase-3
MIAILTDKASHGRDIARILGVTGKGEGFLYGNGYMVTWAPKRLVELAPAGDYGPGRLAASSLPLIPERYLLVPAGEQTAKGNFTGRPARKQLKLLERIFKQCKSIIVATSADYEGELKFRYIYAFLHLRKPFFRLWTSSLTEEAIKTALQNLQAGRFTDNLYLAAGCREKASWLIRVNAGQALHQKYGLEDKAIGWEETPVLTMICSRYAEHRRFRPSAYYQVGITLGKNGLFRHFFTQAPFMDERTAQKTYEHLKKSKKATILQVKKKKIKEAPPLLHTLASLQMEAGRLYGLSAGETLSIAGRLYEKKYISCPQSNGHSSLLATSLKPHSLKEDERQIYKLIACRMAEATAPVCRRETLRVEACLGDIVFTSASSRIISPGWMDIHQAITGEKADTGLPTPAFCEGERVAVSAYHLARKKTLPPPLYTEARLLAALPSAGAAITSLLEHGYIEHSGRSLVPTAIGFSLYDKVKYLRLSDASRAGAWEKSLASIEKDGSEAAAFMQEVEKHTRLITHEILAKKTACETDGIRCPHCGKGQIAILEKAVKCRNPECHLIIFRNFLNKRLSAAHIEQLLTGGSTKLIKGFQTRKGKPFDACLRLDKNGNLTLILPKATFRPGRKHEEK